MSPPDNPQFGPQVSVEPPPLAPLPLLPDTGEVLGTQPSVASRAGESPAWSGWDVLVITILTLGILFISQLVITLAARRFYYHHISWVDVAQKPVLALISEFLAYLPVLLYMFLLLEVKYHTRFWPGIRWNWPRKNVLGLAGIGVLMLGFDALGKYLPMPKTTPFDQFFDSPMNAYLTAAFAMTLGPLMEELFFRGFLYPVIARRLGAFWGIILTALPFGLMHYAQYRSWSAVLIIVLVGIVLTTVRAVTKSVGASFLAHVGYNGTLMVLAAIATDGFRHMEKAGVLMFRF